MMDAGCAFYGADLIMLANQTLKIYGSQAICRVHLDMIHL